MSKTTAENGDWVKFYWQDGLTLEGTLLYTPTAPFDDWIIKDEAGSLVYIQQYEMMRVIERAGDTGDEVSEADAIANALRDVRASHGIAIDLTDREFMQRERELLHENTRRKRVRKAEIVMAAFPGLPREKADKIVEELENVCSLDRIDEDEQQPGKGDHDDD